MRDRGTAGAVGEGATMKPDQTLTWVQDGTERLRAQLAGLSDEALDGPTALPGWNRRYLFSHMAANADALCNLLYWARTGEERRMYASDRAREEGIAAGALASSAELRARFESAAAALAADFDAMTDEAWDAKVITAQGLTRSASEIPWMRTREVYIHAIDLATGITFADLPPEFVTALLDEVDGQPLGQGRRPGPADRRHRHRRPLGHRRRRRPRPGHRPPRRPGRLPDRPPGPGPVRRPRHPALALKPSQPRPSLDLERTVGVSPPPIPHHRAPTFSAETPP